MGRQVRKHDRSGSQAKVEAGLPPKKPRGSDRPLGSAPPAAPASEPPRRHEVRRPARNSSASGGPGLHGSRESDGQAPPLAPPRLFATELPIERALETTPGDAALLFSLLYRAIAWKPRDRRSTSKMPPFPFSNLELQLSCEDSNICKSISLAVTDSDGPGCSTPDSTIAILQQDDYVIEKYSPSVVLPKSGGAVVNMEAPDVEDSRDNEGITMDTEVPSEPPPLIPLVQDEEAVQLARILVNEPVKEFMEGIAEPGVLQGRLSKITSLLVQATSIAAILHDEIPVQKCAQTAALETRVSELEQQVEELSKKLCSAEDKLEVTKVILKETQADMLEAQSDRVTAITAMNSLAMHVGASFARLGTILDPPPNAVDSLEESIKQMTALVSLIGPVSYSHGSSLARSSLTFGVAALLCRERGIEGMREPSAMDTRQFVRSQGPEFQSLISEVVDSMEQRLAEALQGGGWRDSGASKEPGEPTDSKKGKSA